MSECPPGLVFNSNKSTDTGPGGRLPRRLLPPHLPVFTAPFLYCAFPWPSTPPNPLYPLPRPSGHKVFPHALISFCLTHPHSTKHPRNGLFPLSQSREESQKKIPPRLKNPRRYVAQLNSPPTPRPICSPRLLTRLLQVEAKGRRVQNRYASTFSAKLYQTLV